MTKTTRKTALARAITTDAARAIAAIGAMSESLPLEGILPSEAATAGRVGGRVPREAMLIALAVLESAPGSFRDFDASLLADAIAFEDAMAPLAQAALLLSERTTRNIRKRRGEAATQVLGLYQYLKGIARLPVEVPRAQLRALKKLLTTNAPRRATRVTKKEIARATKRLAQKKLAAVEQARVDGARRAADAAVARAAALAKKK